MGTQSFDLNLLDGYELRLPAFEGPFDVLLRLIERSQLAITDVSLVALTDQFLAYLDEVGDAPPATIAEFAAVGARLVLLKSRSLLPRPPAAEEEADPGDLVRQLVAYRSVKEAAQHLAARDARGEGAFAPGGGSVSLPEAVAPPKLTSYQPNVLVRAIRRRLSAVPDPRTAISRRPLISLREMVARILTALSERREVRFEAIASATRDRLEIMTAFLAILVLIRRRVVDAEQATTFGEITLRRRSPLSTPLDEPAADEAADD